MFVGSAFTVGRQDFSIRSMDPLTGKERWNVTYSRLGIGGGPAIASTGGPLPLQTGACTGTMGVCFWLAKQRGPCCWPRRRSLHCSEQRLCLRELFVGWIGTQLLLRSAFARQPKSCRDIVM